MNARSARVGVRQWTRDARAEPWLRVGIVLDPDQQHVVCLRLPRQRYYMLAGDLPLSSVEPHTTLQVRHADAALTAVIGDRPEVRAASFRLEPAVRSPLAPAAGILVCDVVAGRGFHWQKRIDQTLAGTIELLPGRRGIVLVNELPLEDYLAGVITAEMSSACPVEFLKAQCVVARSWLLAMTEPKHAGEPFDRCNDDCCQRYQGTSDLSAPALEAVRATRGRVLLDPAGNVLDANYSKSCGGISETPWAVWGLDKPGIRPVVDAPPDAPERRFFPVSDENLDEFLDGAWLKAARCYCGPNVVPVEAIGRYLGRVDAVGNYFRWTVRYERRELEELLREKLPDAGNLAELRDLRVRARGVSGRAYAMEVEWTNTGGDLERRRVDSEYRIRQVLQRKFLYSSAFAVRQERDSAGRLKTVTLRGAGWGHGVGLCQIGALGMALSGIDYEAICGHYYPQTGLATAY